MMEELDSNIAQPEQPQPQPEQTEQSQVEQPTEQAQQQPEQPQSEQAQQQSAPPKPQNDKAMGWYKFIINFALFAGAVWNVIIGIFYVSGLIYEISDASADLVYLVFPNLQAVDIIYGIAAFAMAAYAIVVRFMLAKFKKRSPLMLYLLYVVVLVVEILYYVFAISITGMSLADAIDTQSIAWFVWQIVFLVGSIVYFSKLKDKFVN